MTYFGGIVQVGQDPHLIVRGSPGQGLAAVTLQNVGNLTIWVGGPEVVAGYGMPLYPSGEVRLSLQVGDELWAARIPNVLNFGAPSVAWPATLAWFGEG